MNKTYSIIDDKILYLNTEVNCTQIPDGTATKNLEFIWKIPPITIEDFAKLNVFMCIQGRGSRTSLPISFRLKNVLFNQNTYYSSENSPYPLLFCTSFDGNTLHYNSDLAGITIIPQTINSISIVVSDVITSQNAGVIHTAGFLLGINIKQYDLKLSEINNPYK